MAAPHFFLTFKLPLLFSLHNPRSSCQSSFFFFTEEPKSQPISLPKYGFLQPKLTSVFQLAFNQGETWLIGCQLVPYVGQGPITYRDACTNFQWMHGACRGRTTCQHALSCQRPHFGKGSRRRCLLLPCMSIQELEQGCG